MNRRRLAFWGLLAGMLAMAWAFAQEGEQPAPAQPAFQPTESIRADQGVAFPVDI